MNKQIGVITIGQSPRTDIMSEMTTHFAEDVTFIEKGVLDHKSSSEIARLAPGTNDTLLVYRLTDGTEVHMGKEKIIPIIQQLIDALNEEAVDLIIIACTGSFPTFKSDKQIIYPDYLLNHLVKGIFIDGTLGVIVPNDNQQEMIAQKWGKEDYTTITHTVSPYTYSETALIESVKHLNDTDVKAIVLDCFGYNQSMKHVAQTYTKKPIILSRQLIYQTIAGIIN